MGAKVSKEEFAKDGWGETYADLLNKTSLFSNKGSLTLKRMGEKELTFLYESDAIVRKIVDKPIQYMLKEGFTVESDEDAVVNKQFNKLGLLESVIKLLTLDRVHGGAVMVIGLSDGKDMEEPVNEGNIKEILFTKVYHRWRVQTMHGDISLDPNNPYFSEPEWLWISPYNGVSFRVHRSRCITSSGLFLDDQETLDNYHLWGDSILNGLLDYITAFKDNCKSSSNIFKSFIQTILSIEGLQKKVSAGQTNLIKQRLDIIKQGLKLGNMVMLDSKEQFSKEASAVSGLDKIWDINNTILSAVAGMPVTLLMGTSPQGMNATGEHDEQNWHDDVSWLQTRKLAPVIDPLVNFICMSKDYQIGISEPVVTYNPLDKLTKKQEIELRKTQAEVDQIYITNNVLTEDEARQSRWGSGVYSFDTSIDTANDKLLLEEREEAKEVQKSAQENKINVQPKESQNGKENNK